MITLKTVSTDSPIKQLKVAEISLMDAVSQLIDIGKQHLANSIFVTGFIELEKIDVVSLINNEGNILNTEDFQILLVIGDDDMWYIEIIDEETRVSYLTDVFEI